MLFYALEILQKTKHTRTLVLAELNFSKSFFAWPLCLSSKDEREIVRLHTLQSSDWQEFSCFKMQVCASACVHACVCACKQRSQVASKYTFVPA